MTIERILQMMALFSLLATVALPAAAGEAPVSSSRQALVVRTASWEAHRGVLQRYERTSRDEAWQPVGGEIPVVVGRRGLGWGLGLHPAGEARASVVQQDNQGKRTGAVPGDEIKIPAASEGVKRQTTGSAAIPGAANPNRQGAFPPQASGAGTEKKEGDGRAPAGVFRLGSAFGYAPRQECSWIRLPYREATTSLKCIDDARSRHYNRLVAAGAGTPADWSSCEDMRRRDDQYRLGIVVAHNADPVVPDRGSCIFLHIWPGPDRGTAGCTAMAPEALEKILRWLDPAAAPVLIQLPEAAYREWQCAWELP